MSCLQMARLCRSLSGQPRSHRSTAHEALSTGPAVSQSDSRGIVLQLLRSFPRC